MLILIKVARDAVALHSLIAEKVNTLTEGIYKPEPSLLSDYNLSVLKPKKPKVSPGKSIIDWLKDEDDRIGFKLKFQHLTEKLTRM